MREINSIDLLSIVLYIGIAVGGMVLLLRRTSYLKQRYRAGAIALFIIAMVVILTGYSGQMITAVWSRILDIMGMNTGFWHTIQRFLWTCSSITAFVGMWLLVLIDSEDLYDVFLRVRRTQKGDVPNEQRAGQPDQEIRTESERLE